VHIFAPEHVMGPNDGVNSSSNSSSILAIVLMVVVVVRNLT
jgi:hypothetical protein